MTVQNHVTSVQQSERELIFTRVFDAPASLVFEAWTNPAHLAHWYGPNGFTVTIQEMDVRVGGVWRLIMHGPDGRDYHNHLVFLEVDKPRRLVYKHEPQHGSEPVSFETTVVFEEENGKTRVTMRMFFPTAEQKNYVVEVHGAAEGGKQTLARLADYLERSSASVVSSLGDKK